MEQTGLSRRDFVFAGAAAAVPARGTKQIQLKGSIPAREFGKTGHRLPVFAMGGAALVEKWGKAYGNTLESMDKRVEMVRHAYDMGVRYFDTSRNYLESETVMGRGLKGVRENVFLSTKVGVDCIGVTGHTAFEPMHKLIDTKLSQSNLQWRELCMTQARELGMGVPAMKAPGSFAFGHNARNLAPDFGEDRLRSLRQAAIRWALREDTPIFLVLGTSFASDIDQNSATLRQDWKFTPEDRKVLADFTVRAPGSKTIQGLKVT